MHEFDEFDEFAFDVAQVERVTPNLRTLWTPHECIWVHSAHLSTLIQKDQKGSKRDQYDQCSSHFCTFLSRCSFTSHHRCFGLFWTIFWCRQCKLKSIRWFLHKNRVPWIRDMWIADVGRDLHPIEGWQKFFTSPGWNSQATLEHKQTLLQPRHERAELWIVVAPANSRKYSRYSPGLLLLIAVSTGQSGMAEQ